MELLKSLYEIYAPSGGEKKIKRFIKHWVKDNIPDAIIRADNNDGNVYIVRGESETYPCIVAHLDQVQDKHSSDFKAVETEDIIFGYSPRNKRREGLGADDKNGIWIALQCLQEFGAIKVAFFVGEEIGCIGSRRCDISWFSDCRFVIEPDRRGDRDLITNISGAICNEEFEACSCYNDYGYKPTSGTMTDVLELSERGIGLSCINLSCGYYDPHTDDEYTVKEDLLNCLEFVKNIIRNCREVYHHKYQSCYSYGRGLSYTYEYGGMGEDDYFPKSRGGSSLDIQLLKMSDFADVESFIDQLVFENCLNYYPEELWQYVGSELETFGMTEEKFLELAYDSFCDYTGWDEEELGL